MVKEIAYEKIKITVVHFLEILCNICTQFTNCITLLCSSVAAIVQDEKYLVRKNVSGFVLFFKKLNNYYKYHYISNY